MITDGEITLAESGAIVGKISRSLYLVSTFLFGYVQNTSSRSTVQERQSLQNQESLTSCSVSATPPILVTRQTFFMSYHYRPSLLRRLFDAIARQLSDFQHNS